MIHRPLHIRRAVVARPQKRNSQASFCTEKMTATSWLCADSVNSTTMRNMSMVEATKSHLPRVQGLIPRHNTSDEQTAREHLHDFSEVFNSVLASVFSKQKLKNLQVIDRYIKRFKRIPEIYQRLILNNLGNLVPLKHYILFAADKDAKFLKTIQPLLRLFTPTKRQEILRPASDAELNPVDKAGQNNKYNNLKTLRQMGFNLKYQFKEILEEEQEAEVFLRKMVKHGVLTSEELRVFLHQFDYVFYTTLPLYG